MKAKLIHIWESIRASFWFVPTLMTAAAIVFSFVMVTLDSALVSKEMLRFSWIYAGGAEGARTLLSTIAGSMMTVAGVTFSITIVALTLASSQYGPRLLRNFMRDKGNQVVLGTFISTFIYCLLVLRTIRGSNGGAFVPHLSVGVGWLLALASLGVLIYFIHHVSVMIQAESLIAGVGHDLDDAIARLFPEEMGEDVWDGKETKEKQKSPDFNNQGLPIAATSSGYLQAIDDDGLMQIARENDMIIRLWRRPGHFVVQGAEIANVWPAERGSDELAEEISAAFVLGRQRTTEQDAELAVHQLVEIAVRALSPGINDPFTAISCIDRLGESLCHLAKRKMPSARRYDSDHRLRVVAEPVTATGMIEAAINQIRQYGRSSVAVTIRLLEMIRFVAAYVRREEDRSALKRQAIMIHRCSQGADWDDGDHEAIERRFRAVMEAMNGAPDEAKCA